MKKRAKRAVLTEEQAAFAANLRRKTTYTWPEIAQRLAKEHGVKTSPDSLRQTVCKRHPVLATATKGGRPGPKLKHKKWRECLKCERPFLSAGIHNRICGNCRESNAIIEAEHIAGDGCRRVNTERSGP